jgi:DNA-binding CsgD family transcriptional regulator
MTASPPRHAKAVLTGRDSERARLDGLLADALVGQSSVLVLRGAAGIGKTALLGYAAERANGFRVARAVGVESEMELPFAGLHQLCGGLLDHLEQVPTPQRDALSTAFGLSSGAQPDRFLVGLAVLRLLSDAAEELPLLCLVDDAQWLDRSSAQVLVFVSRRLHAESVVLLFAERASYEPSELVQLPDLQLKTLSDEHARDLLTTVIPAGPLDEQVRERILAEARGNPLALLELPREWWPAKLAGGFGLPGELPLQSRIEGSFRRRAQQLPADTQRLLLLAAAEPTGEPVLLWRAAAELGVTMDAVAPAEADGLLELGERVAFRHPLLRSAIYHAATAEQRRAAHRALAAATDPEFDPDRRAWHRAYATLAADEEVAAELERSAARAQARGGLPAAAAFLQRAAALTPDSSERARRALQAAGAKQLAGAPQEALTLLSTASDGPLDEFARAMLQGLHGQVALDLRRGGDAVPLLLDAAKRLESIDPGRARETYLEALRAASIAGRLGPGTLAAAKAARGAPPRPGPPRAIDLLLDGLAIRFTDGYAASAAALKRALAAVREEGGRAGQDLRWPWIARRVAPDLFDDEMYAALTTRNVQIARDAGALVVLPLALSALALVRCFEGELATAEGLLAEADEIADATGTSPVVVGRPLLAAYRGEERPALAVIEACEAAAIARNEGVVCTFAEHARAVLNNGLSLYAAALEPAQSAAAFDELNVSVWSLPELIEATSRVGRTELATAALGRLAERTRAAGTDWALGIEARSRAMLSDDEAAESRYREAIERLEGTRVRVELARAYLVYGEWLRREKRRRDAREQLRTAHEMFSAMGAYAFADRAARELLATGETARKRTSDTRDELTPHEAQIARMARDGASNQQIADQLFVSHKTIEYHLHKIFLKLGITSREHLDRVLPGV